MSTNPGSKKDYHQLERELIADAMQAVLLEYAAGDELCEAGKDLVMTMSKLAEEVRRGEYTARENRRRPKEAAFGIRL